MRRYVFWLSGLGFAALHASEGLFRVNTYQINSAGLSYLALAGIFFYFALHDLTTGYPLWVREAVFEVHALVLGWFTVFGLAMKGTYPIIKLGSPILFVIILTYSTYICYRYDANKWLPDLLPYVKSRFVILKSDVAWQWIILSPIAGVLFLSLMSRVTLNYIQPTFAPQPLPVILSYVGLVVGVLLVLSSPLAFMAKTERKTELKAWSTHNLLSDS